MIHYLERRGPLTIIEIGTENLVYKTNDWWMYEDGVEIPRDDGVMLVGGVNIKVKTHKQLDLGPYGEEIEPEPWQEERGYF